jgi:hypothetical protein
MRITHTEDKVGAYAPKGAGKACGVSTYLAPTGGNGLIVPAKRQGTEG